MFAFFLDVNLKTFCLSASVFMLALVDIYSKNQKKISTKDAIAGNTLTSVARISNPAPKDRHLPLSFRSPATFFCQERGAASAKQMCIVYYLSYGIGNAETMPRSIGFFTAHRSQYQFLLGVLLPKYR